MCVDVGVEQLHEQPVEFRVDEARLRQQFLRRRLVVGLRVRWEVRVDLDAPTDFLSAARMDRQAFELQEDLDLVLGDLDAQLLVPVDVRGAVVVAIDVDVAVGMQLGVFHSPPSYSTLGNGLSAAFSIVSKRSRRETPKRGGAVVDALDALGQRPVDLGEGGEARASIAEAHVAHQDFYQSLDDRFILRMLSRAGTTAVE